MSGNAHLSQFESWLVEARPKFKSAKDLYQDKDVPESEPYKLKYEAIDIITQLISDLKNMFDSCLFSENECNHANVCLALFHYEISLNNIATEEASTGEENLKISSNYLSLTNDEGMNTALKIALSNQFGLIWSNRMDYETALTHLTNALDIYNNSISMATIADSPLPLHLLMDPISEKGDTKLSLPEDADDDCESLHTLTLYYLAQVHGNLDRPMIAAKYCQQTLQRQLETKRFDVIDWTLNCATLSQFYLTQNNYQLAKQCLVCSSTVLLNGKTNLQKLLDDENSEADIKESTNEKHLKTEADVARCWVKYCIDILKQSLKAVTLDGTEQINTSTGPLFPDLDIADFHGNVPDSLVSSFQDARLIFIEGQKFCNTAKKFYVLDGYVTDYVEIQQDLSQLYKYLALFEDDFERRCKMHKRRVDLLNVLLVDLNPQHFLQITRQLMFEIAETYSSMTNLKRALLEERQEKRTAQSIVKTNFLSLQSLKYFKLFQDSYKQKGLLPRQYEEDAVRGVLLTYFNSARLYSKYLSLDQKSKLQFLEKENACYQFIVDYCDITHPSSVPQFEEELKICRDMVSLFEVKKSKLITSTTTE